MGHSASTERPHAAHPADHAGFSEAEHQALRKALRVEKDAASARVELAVFLTQFAPHLRPLVQPVFFQLSGEGFGEASVTWPALEAGLSHLIHRGSSWQELLEAWATGTGPPDSHELTPAEVGLYLELAASLCYWCAFPTRTPSAASDAGEPSGSSSPSCGCPELGRLLGSLHGWAELLPAGNPAGLATLAKSLEASIPHLPNAVGPHFASVLLDAPVPAGLGPRGESHILEPCFGLLLRAADAQLWESGAWEPLYRDWADGRSFNALLKGALHYGGPALLLVKTARGEVIGALSTCWEEHHGKFAGTSECFLFSLAPALSVMRSSSRSGNWAYLNSRNKHVPRGLGFGGQPGFFRLWLDVDFEDCYVLQSDATYASGQLLAGGDGLQTPFHASVIEVWACGGEEARAEQDEQRQRDEGMREQARKVDKAKLVENEFDKEMFFGKTFKVSERRENASGS